MWRRFPADGRLARLALLGLFLLAAAGLRSCLAERWQAGELQRDALRGGQLEVTGASSPERGASE
jgi:hypothetical protein